jgi:hypothetical protein
VVDVSSHHAQDFSWVSPNFMATFANNPAVLEGYLALDAAFEKASFTPRERQTISTDCERRKPL